MSGVFNQEQFDRELLTTIMTAFPKKLVMEVVRTISVAEHRHRQASGWKLFGGTSDEVPKDTQWVQIKNRVYVRDSADFVREFSGSENKATARKKEPAKKTDASVRKADIRCPMCQSVMYREPICRGCKEGKAGYRVRLICGENDEHTWIV